MVPVVFGEGIRLFDELDGLHVALRQSQVVTGTDVTPLCHEIVGRSEVGFDDVTMAGSRTGSPTPT